MAYVGGREEPELLPKYRDPKRRLSARFVRSILHYDPETGVFTWRRRADRSARWNTRYAGTPAGTVSGSTRYRFIEIRRPYPAHRLAWLYMTGRWPEEQIDHVNRDRSDNRFANLTCASNAENARNRGAQSNNRSSGHRNISRHFDGRWRVRVRADGRDHHVGCYHSLADAIAAQRRAVEMFHGPFADSQRARAAAVSR